MKTEFKYYFSRLCEFGRGFNKMIKILYFYVSLWDNRFLYQYKLASCIYLNF